MNIEEYISSGILEAYVLGSLSKEEARDVEAKAALYPGIAEELLNIQTAMEHYAMAHAVKPPDRIKKKIFDNLDSGKILAKESAEPKEIPLPVSNQNNNWMVAASVSVALISTISSFYFYNQWKGTEYKLLALQEESKVYALRTNHILEAKEIQLKEHTQYFYLSLDTATTRVAMKGLAISPASAAIVLWNKRSNDVYIDIQSLPAPPAGMQYQLWALDNGVPIDAGVFLTGTEIPFQKMKSIEHAQAFAVTLEKAGGSPTPTLDAMYVMGTL